MTSDINPKLSSTNLFPLQPSYINFFFFFYPNPRTFRPTSSSFQTSPFLYILIHHHHHHHHQYYQQGCGADPLPTSLAQTPRKPPVRVPDLRHPFDPIDCLSLPLLSTFTNHQTTTPDPFPPSLLTNQPRLHQQPHNYSDPSPTQHRSPSSLVQSCIPDQRFDAAYPRPYADLSFAISFSRT